jgi:hypothetical protein
MAGIQERNTVIPQRVPQKESAQIPSGWPVQGESKVNIFLTTPKNGRK